MKTSDPILIMMIGIPGCGKTYTSKYIENQFKMNNKHVKIVSSDEIRNTMGINSYDKVSNRRVFRKVNDNAKEFLKQGFSVIHDATNLSSKRRMDFLSSLRNIKCRKYCWLIPRDFSQCVNRDSGRKNPVGEKVIRDKIKSFNVPSKLEGFQKIFIDWSCVPKSKGKEEGIKELINSISTLEHISQDDPHHTLTIGDHCKKTYQIMNEFAESDEYDRCAAFLHDVGKLFCQSYDDLGVAHYTGHENYSAYKVLSLLKRTESISDTGILEISFLINNHMKLFTLNGIQSNVEKERAHQRLKRKIGKFYMDKLTLLYLADSQAK